MPVYPFDYPNTILSFQTFPYALSIRAMNEPRHDNGLTNYESINVYNEQVHEKGR